MNNKPKEYNRRSIRLRNYDYSQAGAYFVTICTQDRKCMFGEIVDGEVHLNDVGQIIQSTWIILPERFPDVELDQYMIMPNHLHGIIRLAGKQFIASDDFYVSKVPVRFEQHMYAKGYQRPVILTPTLGQIIRTFKALATHYIRAAGVSDFAWQGDYYDHVIRNDDDLDRIRQYIIDNSIRWTENSSFTEEGFIV